MHEMSIATELLEIILEIADKNKIDIIEEVHVKSGVLKKIVPDVMDAAFIAVVEGTIAEKAKLTLEEVSAQVRCNKCKISFKPEIDDFLCPVCNKADVEVISGNDMIISSVTGYSKNDIEKGKKDED